MLKRCGVFGPPAAAYNCAVERYFAASNRVSHGTDRMQDQVYPTPSNSRLPRLLLILATLCLGLVLPYLAEQVQYSITRGELRARADAAAEAGGLPVLVGG